MTAIRVAVEDHFVILDMQKPIGAELRGARVSNETSNKTSNMAGRFLRGDKPDARPTDCRRATGDCFGQPSGVAISTVIDHDDLDRRVNLFGPAAGNNRCRSSGRLRPSFR